MIIFIVVSTYHPSFYLHGVIIIMIITADVLSGGRFKAPSANKVSQLFVDSVLADWSHHGRWMPYLFRCPQEESQSKKLSPATSFPRVNQWLSWVHHIRVGANTGPVQRGTRHRVKATQSRSSALSTSNYANVYCSATAATCLEIVESVHVPMLKTQVM